MPPRKSYECGPVREGHLRAQSQISPDWWASVFTCCQGCPHAWNLDVEWPSHICAALPLALDHFYLGRTDGQRRGVPQSVCRRAVPAVVPIRQSRERSESWTPTESDGLLKSEYLALSVPQAV